MGILVGGGPASGINSAIGAAVVAAASELQAKATAEPPATKANRHRKARRDKLPPRILSVVDTDHSSAQRQNLS
jgi:hypothetical protein